MIFLFSIFYYYRIWNEYRQTSGTFQIPPLTFSTVAHAIAHGYNNNFRNWKLLRAAHIKNRESAAIAFLEHESMSHIPIFIVEHLLARVVRVSPAPSQPCR